MLRNILRLYLVIASIVLITNESKAQDPAFSQFYANHLYLNPAFAGAKNDGCPTASLHYRDQWPGIGRTYVTTSVSWDQHIESIGGGLGIEGGRGQERKEREREKEKGKGKKENGR